MKKANGIRKTQLCDALFGAFDKVGRLVDAEQVRLRRGPMEPPHRPCQRNGAGSAAELQYGGGPYVVNGVYKKIDGFRAERPFTERLGFDEGLKTACA